MEGEEIGGAEYVVRAFDPFDTELTKALACDERVERDHPHSEPERPAGDLLADPAEAEHAERLALELDPAPGRALPATLLQGRVRLRDVARERDQEPDRVLGGRRDCRFRGVRDHDSAPRRGLDVDVVHPDAGAADHLQPLGALEQVCGQFRRGADHDRVVAADLLGQIRVGVDVHVEPLAKELDPGIRDRLSDEDPRARHTGVCSKASSARVTATPRSTSAPSSTSASSTAPSAVVTSKTS